MLHLFPNRHTGFDLTIIKDVITIASTITITSIAFLTYLRAKETILQPIRTEVIKSQIPLLTGLLEYICSAAENKADEAIDYRGLIKVNTTLLLDEYGFRFSDHKTMLTEAKKQSVGMVFYARPGESLKDIELISAVKKSEPYVADPVRRSKELYESAKRGDVHIDHLHLTKRHMEFMNRLTDYVNNPFMPLKIRYILEDLIKNIQINLNKHLTTVLKGLIIRLITTEISSQEDPTLLSSDGLWNEFNHIRINNKGEYARLKSSIREYLKIDSMP